MSHQITLKMKGAPSVMLFIDGDGHYLDGFCDAWYAAWEIVPKKAKALIVQHMRELKKKSREPYGLRLTLEVYEPWENPLPEWDYSTTEQHLWRFPKRHWPKTGAMAQRRVILKLLALMASFLVMHHDLLVSEPLFQAVGDDDICIAWDTGKTPKGLKKAVQLIDQAIAELERSKAAIIPHNIAHNG